LFLWRLRELHIRKGKLSYKCKSCEKIVIVEISDENLEKLQKGHPFSSVFGKTLLHFKEGICVKCLMK